MKTNSLSWGWGVWLVKAAAKSPPPPLELMKVCKGFFNINSSWNSFHHVTSLVFCHLLRLYYRVLKAAMDGDVSGSIVREHSCCLAAYRELNCWQTQSAYSRNWISSKWHHSFYLMGIRSQIYSFDPNSWQTKTSIKHFDSGGASITLGFMHEHLLKGKHIDMFDLILKYTCTQKG